MTQPTAQPHEAQPILDLPAILSALQDQIDDLRATVTAQQTVIEELQARDD
jgi:hypothetical protein